MVIFNIGASPAANVNQKRTESNNSGDFQKWMSEAADGKVGFAYIDQYGFSHVVSDYQTAKKYAKPNTEVYLFHGEYGGGYAKSEDGKRLAVPLPGFVPYGNTDPAVDAPVLTGEQFEQEYPHHIVGLARNFIHDFAMLFKKHGRMEDEVLEGDQPFVDSAQPPFSALPGDIRMKEKLEKMMLQVKNPYQNI